MSQTCRKCQASLRDTAQFCHICGSPVEPMSLLCPACGKGNRAGAQFCQFCGQKLAVVTSVEITCVHCGSPAQPGVRICSNCGKPIDGILCPRCQRANRLAAVFCAHCGTDLHKPPISHPFETGRVPINTLLNQRFLVVKLIKQGGMSAIYLVKDTQNSDQLMAAKEMSFSMLKDGLAGEEEPYSVDDYKTLFRQEYDILRQSDHPNLPRVVDSFEANGRPYFVMEFIDGKTLEQVLHDLPAGQYLPEQLVLTWAWQICDVLDYLHHCEPPIIYRDLKPGNLMVVNQTDHIKLIDFGIARFYKPHQTKDTYIFGTPGYAPPELYVRSERGQTNPASDIYSLGATLHHLLTRRDPGRQPFQFLPVVALNPAISQRTSDAIQKAVQYQPDQRQQSTREFLHDLFGPQAEFERLKDEEVQGDLPGNLDMPSISQPISSHPLKVGVVEEPEIVVSDHVVEFGQFEHQREPFDVVMAVTIKSGAAATARFDKPWFRSHPTQWTGSQFLQLGVDAKTIQLSNWQPGAAMERFERSPKWVKDWAGWHARRMVQQSRDCSGELKIITDKAQEAIAVKAVALPEGKQNQKAWSSVLTWMVIEAVVAVGLLVILLDAIF